MSTPLGIYTTKSKFVNKKNHNLNIKNRLIDTIVTNKVGAAAVFVRPPPTQTPGPEPLILNIWVLINPALAPIKQKNAKSTPSLHFHVTKINK